MLEICTSTNGMATPARASRRATLVCVSPPGLMTMASTPSVRAAWMRSISAPSWLLWKQDKLAPAAAAWATAACSMSARVLAPYTSGSRLPSKFRLGPLSSRSFVAMSSRPFSAKVPHFAANGAPWQEKKLRENLYCWLQSCQVCTQLVEFQLAQISLLDLAVGADQHRVGQAAGAVAKVARQVRAFHAAHVDRVGDLHAVGEFGDIGLGIDADAYDLQFLAGVGRGQRGQFRHFAHAGAAPWRPEVDQHRLALPLRQRLFDALAVRQRLLEQLVDRRAGRGRDRGRHQRGRRVLRILMRAIPGTGRAEDQCNDGNTDYIIFSHGLYLMRSSRLLLMGATN